MRLSTTAALAALLLTCATAALAETSPPKAIAIGDTARGTLDKGEYDDRFKWIMDRYDLSATKGQRVTITLESRDFDPYIDLDHGEEHVDADDDGGEVFDAKLVLDIPETGVYRINVTSSGDHDETGAYTLKVVRGGTLPEPAPEPAPARARTAAPASAPIRLGQTIQGRLSDASPLDDDDTPYEGFAFTGKRGQSVSIDMKSNAFDAYVALRRKGYDGMVRDDDDGGEGTDAHLTAILPADGDYEIRANTPEEGARGAFTLTLADGPPRVAPTAAAISYGQTLRGELKEGDALDDDNTLYDLYRFKGRARDKVTISLRSDDFDAFLKLTLPNGGRELANNDDVELGENGPDAEIKFTLPADADYEIRANTLRAGATGRYVLGLSLEPR